MDSLVFKELSWAICVNRCTLVGQNCVHMPYSEGEFKSESARVCICTHTHPHTHTQSPTKYMGVLPGIEAERGIRALGVLSCLGEWGSGMFSKFCFGVRLSGDRASINLAEHLGSLKPERALQFINLNLLPVQLEASSRRPWQDTDVAHSAALAHQQSCTAPPPLPRPRQPAACHVCLQCSAHLVLRSWRALGLGGILWATLLAPGGHPILSHWPSPWWNFPSNKLFF